jgi:hypothetical protein
MHDRSRQPECQKRETDGEIRFPDFRYEENHSRNPDFGVISRILTNPGNMYLRLLLFPFFLTFLFSPSISSSQLNSENAGVSVAELKTSRFILTLNGGGGYLTGRTKTAKAQMRNMGVSESDIDHYFRDFKTGAMGSASLYYLWTHDLGIGVDYHVFTTRGQVRGYVDPGDGWTKYYGIFSDEVFTNFVGLSFLTRENNRGKLGFYTKLSLGMALYRDEGSLINTPVLITGQSFAVSGELGLTYSLSRHFSLNLGFSYMVASLGKINSNNGTGVVEIKLDKDTRENLSRYNLTGGLVYNF